MRFNIRMKRNQLSLVAFWIAVFLLFSANNPSYAVDAAYVWYSGGKKADNITVGLQWDWDKRWLSSDGKFVGGYWDVNISQWHGSDHFTLQETQIIKVAGVTPMFRWQNDSKTGYYLEGGIGARWITALWDNAGRQLSTHYQFADTIAAGYAYHSGLDVALKLEHTSNAGIKMPNSGMNFFGVRLKYHF